MRRAPWLVATGCAAALALLAQALPAHAAEAHFAKDDAVTTVRARAVVIDVIANDTGEALQVTEVSTPPVNGTAVLTSDSSITYTPTSGFLGTDTFAYQVSDGSHTDQATVAVTVVEAVSVATPGTWTVLLPTTLSGTGPAGGAIAVRITGPDTDRTLAVPVPASSHWSTTFVPSWPGPHTVAATVTEPKIADTATTHAVAAAKYLWGISGTLTRAVVAHSYRPGCPVRPSQLRTLSITYWDWSGRVQRGQLVASYRVVDDLRAIFRVAFRTRFPLRSVIPVDKFYRGPRHSPAQSDLRTMQADNTSAYNCRRVTGNPRRESPHAYGTAIDINPLENPYVTAHHVYPGGSKPFLKRWKHRKGMLLPSSPIVKAFRARGWRWGVRFTHPDYQHFQR